MTSNTRISIEDEYRAAGYETHYNRIDAEAAEETPCVVCCGKCDYIGLKKVGPSRTSYIAISRCRACGHESEF